MGCIIKHSRGVGVIPSHVPVKGDRCKACSITEIFSSGVWKDEICFLIGGGPSLSDFDFSLVGTHKTIGINKAFIRFPVMVTYCMDYRFYDMLTHPSRDNIDFQELHKQWKQFTGIKLFLRRSCKLKFDPSVYYVDALQRKSLSFDLNHGIWPGNNSGFGGLMLAIALGSRRIGLLGFDLKVKKGRTHWHQGYPYQNTNDMQKILAAFTRCFEEFAPTIRAQGIEVVNLSPDSSLDCFKKMSIEEFSKT